MLGQDARTNRSPASTVPPGRGSSRQLALPLAPFVPPELPPPTLPRLAGGAPVRPRQVWARLPPAVQAEVRRVVWQVLEEVLHNEPRH